MCCVLWCVCVCVCVCVCARARACVRVLALGYIPWIHTHTHDPSDDTDAHTQEMSQEPGDEGGVDARGDSVIDGADYNADEGCFFPEPGLGEDSVEQDGEGEEDLCVWLPWQSDLSCASDHLSREACEDGTGTPVYRMPCAE